MAFEASLAEEHEVAGADDEPEDKLLRQAERVAKTSDPAAHTDFEAWYKHVKDYIRIEAPDYCFSRMSKLRPYFRELWAEKQPAGIELIEPTLRDWTETPLAYHSAVYLETHHRHPSQFQGGSGRRIIIVCGGYSVGKNKLTTQLSISRHSTDRGDRWLGFTQVKSPITAKVLDGLVGFLSKDVEKGGARLGILGLLFSRGEVELVAPETAQAIEGLADYYDPQSTFKFEGSRFRSGYHVLGTCNPPCDRLVRLLDHKEVWLTFLDVDHPFTAVAVLALPRASAIPQTSCGPVRLSSGGQAACCRDAAQSLDR